MKPAPHVSLDTSLTALEGRVERVGLWPGFGPSPPARARWRDRRRVCRDIGYALREHTNTAKPVRLHREVLAGSQATGCFGARDWLYNRDSRCPA